jgi:hypothetical protein
VSLCAPSKKLTTNAGLTTARHTKRKNLLTHEVKLVERSYIYALGYKPINLAFLLVKSEMNKILRVNVYKF